MEKDRQEFIEKALDFVANKGWIEKEDKFLNSLCKFLGDTFNFDYALIDEYSIKTPHLAKTVAVYTKNGFVPNIEYELKDTPCNNVIGSKMCSYETNIQKLFPNDELLVQMQVDSYCAIPLWSSNREPIGLIALMDGKPFSDLKTIELVLQIVATKAAQELEKQLYENKLQQQIMQLQISEEELKATNEELLNTANELRRSNTQLKNAKEKAEESNRLKTEFINNMSHEIRTPLNGILGFSKMLDKPGLPDEKRRQFTKIIVDCGERLLKIIDDILEISRLVTEQTKINEETFCLNEFLSEIFAGFDAKAKEKNISLYFRKRFAHEQSIVCADKGKLNKILGILIENALKFTHEGCVEFGYKNNGKANEFIEFFVKDTGIGIADDKQKFVFERFTQVEREKSPYIGGLGLGLSIAKEIVELMGGSISLKSEIGKGTSFFISLPFKNVAAPSDSDELAMEPQTIANVHDKASILVVDDEELNYRFLKTLFDYNIDVNCTLLHAINGKKAVELCNENPDIDLVLMDLKMPVMDGFEATKRIKKTNPGLPIIAQTAYITDEDKQKALSVGCDDYITKPIKEETINKMIERYLKGKSANA